MEIKDIIKKLTLEEKARLLCGYKTMETYPIERLNIPSLIMSDGPSGVRKQKENGNSLTGLANSLPTNAYPSGNNLASTWNEKLIYEVGTKIGSECKHYGIDMLLGPAINIRKNPLCGRNFEYYSEDPLLSGIIGKNFINGLQSLGVYSCIKHFACNNNETFRFVGDSIVDERSLREIYLKPFEIVINESKPKAVMTSYNKVNNEHASENNHLFDILKNEWKYQGISITDWGGLKDRINALKAGTTIEMPGMVNHNISKIIMAVNNNELDISIVDHEVEKLLFLLKEKKPKVQCNFDLNFDTVIKSSIESGVLLENDGVLPLSKKERYLVIGDFFERPRYQGSGSSIINPYKVSTHIDAFLKENIKFEYEKGFIGIHKDDESINKYVKSAVTKALEHDTIIFYGGLTDFEESEGLDRESIKLARNQVTLIKELSKLNKKMIFVIFGGNAIDISDVKDLFNAILYMGLPGSAIGISTTKLLFGDESPSGKLPITWPKSYDDILFGSDFLKNPIELYKDSIYVGYRYFSTINKEVLYPFGYGLSYSKFEYSNFSIYKNNNEIDIKLNIKNIGKYNAKKIIQVYARLNKSNIGRPVKVLVGFTKVHLNSQEESEAIIKIKINNLKIYNEQLKKFVLEDGDYDFIISEDVTNEIKSLSLYLEGTHLNNDGYQISNIISMTDDEFINKVGYKYTEIQYQKAKYTLETPVYMYKTITGKLFNKIVRLIGINGYKKAIKHPNKQVSFEKENKIKSGYFVSKMLPYNNLRSMCFSSSGLLKYNITCGLLDIINNRPIKGLFKMLRKDRIINDKKN